MEDHVSPCAACARSCYTERERESVVCKQISADRFGVGVGVRQRVSDFAAHPRHWLTTLLLLLVLIGSAPPPPPPPPPLPCSFAYRRCEGVRVRYDLLARIYVIQHERWIEILSQISKCERRCV